MGKRLIFFLILLNFFGLIILANIIFSYNRCIRPLEKVSFYGSVMFIEELDFSYRMYVSISPSDLFTVYIDKKDLHIDSFDELYSNPVCIESRFWNNYYEVYNANGLRFSRLSQNTDNLYQY